MAQVARRVTQSGRVRLDVELVRRGLARSRDHARELVAAGRVNLRGTPARKAATPVDATTLIEVAEDGPDYVSRAGHKLAGALAAWQDQGLRVEGRRCLDAGASTGGFTDVLLRAGAAEVVAVDVGHGQLVDQLRRDPRVRAYDKTNVRDLQPEQVGGRVELLVADLSFISLRLVLPALVGLVGFDDGAGQADLIVLVKPQFELGSRAALDRTGVVRAASDRAAAVRAVAETAVRLGLRVAGMARSGLPGPAGNREYLLWLRREVGPAMTTQPPLDVLIADVEAEEDT